MTHSLHRFGTVENLKNDFCIYARAAKGINRDNCEEKLMQIFDIFLSEDFVNFGHGHVGKSYVDGLKVEEYKKMLQGAYGFMVNFGDAEVVGRILHKLSDANLGISVVVSGLIKDVVEIAQKNDLKPHTASLSLGVFGDKSLLPEDEVLEITTMCGHSLVGNSLVRSKIEKVKNGTESPEQASLELAKPCVCGIFNTRRCSKILYEKQNKS